MNKHIFPLQQYKHCSFPFFENNISFIQIFTRLILENHFPFKCNILKHNLGRVKERPTETWSTWPLASIIIIILPSNQGQRLTDRPASHLPTSGSKVTQKNTHEAILKFPEIKRPTHTTPTESISRVKNTSYHIERVLILRWQHLILAHPGSVSVFAQWLERPYQFFCRQWMNILY